MEIDGSGYQNFPGSSFLSPYGALEYKNRYGDYATVKPFVKKVNYPAGIPDASKRTYAIILQGYDSHITNTEVSWNDCSFIYQVLTNKLGIPKYQVFPMMAKGNIEECKIKKAGGGFGTHSRDLDGDGIQDVTLGAYLSTFKDIIKTLDSVLKEDDHLFVFIDGPCVRDKETGKAYIPLNYYMEHLDAKTLADYLSVFCDRRVNVNVVMGHRYSGDFAEALKDKGCVVASACSGDEDTWAYTYDGKLPFNSFLYHWISAVNEADHIGVPVSADVDGDGHVNMIEAYKYAKGKCHPDMHPKYYSTPSYLGDDLAFTYLPPAENIYIKDDDADKGVEPNPNPLFWDGPSIWVRNEDDTIHVHQNPYRAPNHRIAYIYVTVHNRGKKAITGGRWVRIYWALGSTHIAQTTWKGREVNKHGNRTGTTIISQTLTPEGRVLNPGDSITFSIPWALDEPLNSENETRHFCIAAKIMNTPFEDGYVPGEIYIAPRAYKTHAQKNLTIIDKKNLNGWNDIYMRSNSDSAQPYSLELKPRTSIDANLFYVANVNVRLKKSISSGWLAGGGSGIGCRGVLTSDTMSVIKITSPNNSIQNIILGPHAVDHIGLGISFKNPNVLRGNYKLDLIQKDKHGTIIGGETFLINPFEKSTALLTIVTGDSLGEGTILTANSEDFASVTWQNCDGDDIGTGKSVVVKPSPGNYEFSACGITEDGEIAFASISLEDQYGIESLRSEDGVGETLDVNLRSQAADNTQLVISSALEGRPVLTHQVETGSKSAEISVGHLAAGIYAVTLVNDGETIDSRKFIKK